MGLRADFVARREGFEVTVTLDVADGETLAMLGPNGAGKSTVVDALTGTVELAEGTIELDGERIDHLPPERRAIGVCFQDDLLFPRLSVLENVAFPLRAQKVAKGTARARARTAPAVARRAVQQRRRLGAAGHAHARSRCSP